MPYIHLALFASDSRSCRKLISSTKIWIFPAVISEWVRRRSHRSVRLIERNRALELCSTPATHLGPHRREAADDAGPPDAQLSAPALDLPTPRASGRVE